MHGSLKMAAGLIALVAGGVAFAAQDGFTAGPVIEGYGNTAPAETLPQLDPALTFKVAFDTAKSGEGELNRTINSAARFLNMQAKAGVAPENIQLAVVFHGKATSDVAVSEDNPNAELVALLQEKGVRFMVCGQSAAYYGVAEEDLLPGVEMAVSAMTAHALLQQDGYTLNPF